jgi:uncharacterized protein (TIGR03067 family)
MWESVAMVAKSRWWLIRRWLALAVLGSPWWFTGCDRATKEPLRLPADAASESAVAPVAAIEQEGRWATASATLAGTPFPKSVTDTISLELTGDAYKVDVGGKPDRGTCTIDLEQSPHRMTIKGIEGPNAGKTMLAIFDFPNPQEMRVCYDLQGKQFPAGFSSTAEDGFYLVVYTRQP